MPRRSRLNIPNIPQHVIQRGNNRQVCFFEKNDYIVYLSKLREYAVQLKIAIHAYVLMTNHVHLLLTPTTETGLSKLMQLLGSYYVLYINKRYERSGTLWEGRFKSCLVGTEEYFLTVSRYIELNPVRAKMVEHPSQYTWSSYQGNALGKKIKLLTPHFSYLTLGCNTSTRQKTYQLLFNDLIPNFTLDRIRAATNKTWMLGDLDFQKRMEEKAGRTLIPPQQRGGDRKSKSFKFDLNRIKNQLL